MSTEPTAQNLRILDRLRAFGANYAELTRQFADWLGLHTTDAAALVEILAAEDKGQPLTPTRLSRKLGLSTGAATNLLNRLERLGHIVRSREHSDRRVVTVRSSPDIEGPAVEFFTAFSAELADLTGQYDAADLALIEDFLTRLNEATHRVITEQAGGTGTGGTTVSRRSGRGSPSGSGAG